MKMLQYTVKRFVIMLFTLFIIATATFFLLAATPGDALSARVEKLPDSVAARMYAKYGLDKPVMERYVITMKGLVHGDFGESIIYEGQTVQSIIKEKAPISARLGIQQMLLGVSLGLALGVLAAVKKGSFWDYLVVALSILLISVPNLVFALLLQQVFAGKLGWFPVWGFESWRNLLLPVLIGVATGLGANVRFYRTILLEEMHKDYVRTAFAKGLRTEQVLFKHVLKNALGPVIVNVALALPYLYTGSLLLESFFGIPGLGYLSLNAIHSADVEVVRAIVLVGALLFTAANVLADVALAWVDPRVKLA